MNLSPQTDKADSGTYIVDGRYAFIGFNNASFKSNNLARNMDCGTSVGLGSPTRSPAKLGRARAKALAIDCPVDKSDKPGAAEDVARGDWYDVMDDAWYRDQRSFEAGSPCAWRLAHGGSEAKQTPAMMSQAPRLANAKARESGSRKGSPSARASVKVAVAYMPIGNTIPYSAGS